ncbi:ComEC/Rec2 family competence protein [Candidatus Berkelbacteria bacterium]|nr:ComEC/Rec2 family competence protein [Candidatus Berkelbacteria bacterium]
MIAVLGAIAALLASALALHNAYSWVQVPLAILILLLGIGFTLWRQAALPIILEESEYIGRIIIQSEPGPAGRQFAAYGELDSGLRVRLVFAPSLETEVHYGDELLITGALRPPEWNREFNERGFLLAHGAVGVLENETIEKTGQNLGNPIIDKIFRLRAWLLKHLSQTLEPPNDTLIAGILLGARTELAANLKEAFQRTGLTHILVASGSNVLVLALAVQFLLLPFGRRLSLYVSLALVVIFMILAGLDASVVRAGIFYAFTVLALLMGRQVHLPTTLLSVAGLLALINPWAPRFDISFQLSFAAVAGLFIFTPVFLKWLPAWSGREYLAPTLAAELATLPIILYYFNEVSIVAPLANVLVLPFVPALMGLGFLALILGWLPIIPWVTNGISTVILTVVSFFSAQTWASADLISASAKSILLIILLGMIGIMSVIRIRLNFQEVVGDER